MKRIVLIITALTLWICASAQNDSLEQELKQYKSLFEQGLITQQEYDAVKAKALKIQGTVSQSSPAVTTVNVESLNRKWRKQVLGGGITIGLGLGAEIFAVAWRNKVIEPGSYYDGNGDFHAGEYNQAVKDKNRDATVVAVFGAVFMGVGTGLVIAGVINKSIYENRKGKLSAGITPSGAGLVYVFR